MLSYTFRITLKEHKFPKDWPIFASTEVTRVFAIDFSGERLTVTTSQYYVTSASLQRQQQARLWVGRKQKVSSLHHLSTAPLPLFQLQTT